MLDLSLFEAAYAVVVLFLAYLVRGVAGFGSGLIAVPLLAIQFPVPLVVPLVVFLDYVGSASQGLHNRDRIAWRELLSLVPFALIGIALGLTLLKAVPPATLAQILGGFVIVYGIYQLLRLPEVRGSRLFAAPCGLLGGLIGTLFGTGGPLYVIYFGLRGLDKGAARATFAVNFLIDGGFRLGAYATFGLFGGKLVLTMLAALPVVAVALWLGGRVHAEISPLGYKRLISLLLLVSGLALLLKG